MSRSRYHDSDPLSCLCPQRVSHLEYTWSRACWCARGSQACQCVDVEGSGLLSPRSEGSIKGIVAGAGFAVCGKVLYAALVLVVIHG